jgi:hypothetical protein
MAILAMSPMGILPMVFRFFVSYILHDNDNGKSNGKDTPVRA